MHVIISVLDECNRCPCGPCPFPWYSAVSNGVSTRVFARGPGLQEAASSPCPRSRWQDVTSFALPPLSLPSSPLLLQPLKPFSPRPPVLPAPSACDSDVTSSVRSGNHQTYVHPRDYALNIRASLARLSSSSFKIFWRSKTVHFQHKINLSIQKHQHIINSSRNKQIPFDILWQLTNRGLRNTVSIHMEIVKTLLLFMDVNKTLFSKKS